MRFGIHNHPGKRLCSILGEYQWYSEGYHQFCRGCTVFWRMCSTLKVVQFQRMFNNVDGYHQYCGGSSVLFRDTINTVEGYHQYCGGCSVLLRDTTSTLGIIFTILVVSILSSTLPMMSLSVLNNVHSTDAIRVLAVLQGSYEF